MKPRQKPLVRHSGIKRGTSRLARSAIKRKPRPASETLRIYGPPERRAWVKSLPCLVCGATPSENAHVENDGLSRKGDADKIVPLCHQHHIGSLHRIGPEPFERLYARELLGRSLKQWAETIEHAWQIRHGAAA